MTHVLPSQEKTKYLSTPSWWERLIKPVSKRSFLCINCNTTYDAVQLLCSIENCGAVLPVQEIGKTAARVWVSLYRLLMVLVGISVGYFSFRWPGCAFSAITFYGLGYLLLRHYREALLIYCTAILLILVVDWGTQFQNLIAYDHIHIAKQYAGIAALIFMWLCGLTHFFSQSKTVTLKAVDAAFLTFILLYFIRNLGWFLVPGVALEITNRLGNRLLLSTLSFAMAALSIDAVVYTGRQPAFVIPDLIRHIPTLPLRSLPRLGRADPMGHGFLSHFAKSMVSLINSVLRSIENFYNRLLRQLLNISIRFPIQMLNYTWRKLIALIRHLGRSIKRLVEQFGRSIWSIIRFLYHFARVILIPVLLIVIVYQQSWQLGNIIFHYIHHGPLALIWSGLLIVTTNLGCIFAIAWLMTRCAFGSLLMFFVPAVFDFTNKFLLLYAVVSWLFIAVTHYVVPAPYRIGPLTIVTTLWLLILLAAALLAGKIKWKTH